MIKPISGGPNFRRGVRALWKPSKPPSNPNSSLAQPEDRVSSSVPHELSQTHSTSKPTAVTELSPEDMEEFRRYAPVLIIDSKEQYAPVPMNFDEDWNLLNNASNFKRLRSQLSQKEILSRYSVAYVNKLENVMINGERFTVYQYWFYWPFNNLPFDWHDHDLEYVQVYVDANGKVRKVYTSYHFWHRIRERLLRAKRKLLEPTLARDTSPGRSARELVKNLLIPFPQILHEIDVAQGAHSEGDNLSALLYKGTHPIVIVEPNTHGMVFHPKESFLLRLLGFSPKVALIPQRLIPMMSSKDEDSPFPEGRDERGLVDDKGYLKNRGFPYNWFVRVRSPVLRRSFWEGAHSVSSSSE